MAELESELGWAGPGWAELGALWRVQLIEAAAGDAFSVS